MIIRIIMNDQEKIKVGMGNANANAGMTSGESGTQEFDDFLILDLSKKSTINSDCYLTTLLMMILVH